MRKYIRWYIGEMGSGIWGKRVVRDSRPRLRKDDVDDNAVIAVIAVGGWGEDAEAAEVRNSRLY